MDNTQKSTTPEMTEDHVEQPAAEELAALQAQVKDLKDQLLYALAEAENARKRHAKEKEDQSKFAVAGFSRDLLGVADNLDLALNSQTNGDMGQAFQNLRAGIELTSKELMNVFERYQIRKINPAVGDTFDHNIHQAVSEIASDDHPAGTIVQVFQAGYMLHDRLLRPAMVIVAKK